MSTTTIACPRCGQRDYPHVCRRIFTEYDHLAVTHEMQGRVYFEWIEAEPGPDASEDYPAGGLPHGEHPYDYGYGPQADRREVSVATRTLRVGRIALAVEWPRECRHEPADPLGRMIHPVFGAGRWRCRKCGEYVTEDAGPEARGDA